MSAGDWKELYQAAVDGDLDLVSYHISQGTVSSKPKEFDTSNTMGTGHLSCAGSVGWPSLSFTAALETAPSSAIVLK